MVLPSWSWIGWLCLLAGCTPFHPLKPRTPPEPAPAAAAPSTPVAAPVSVEPQLAWREIGQTVQGRSLRATTVGSGPRRVLWIGSIHGNEKEGRVATAELPWLVRRTSGAESSVTLTILEDANPDGTAMNVRGNANGVDLNRNFPARNFRKNRFHGGQPLSQPEARAVHDLIQQLEPHLVIVAHSWRDAHFINYDGPAAARTLAERFARLSGYPLRRSDQFAETPGSLGSWVGADLGIPILTLEYFRAREPVAAWNETRTAILAVILDRDA
jgi:hypothetical protein